MHAIEDVHDTLKKLNIIGKLWKVQFDKVKVDPKTLIKKTGVLFLVQTR